MPSIKSKKFFLIYITILLILGSFTAGIFVGRSNFVKQNVDNQNNLLSNKNSDNTEKVDFNLFWEAWNMVEKKYIEQPLDYKKMLYGSIEGMVSSLDDPYTSFMDPEMSKEFKEEIDGNFEGVGAEIGIKNDQLTIIAPLSNSPAEKVGLRARDVILEIDGKDTSEMNLIEAVYLIRGEKDTEVILTISRKNSDVKQYKIKRDKIEVNSVEWKKIKTKKGNNVAYIELSYFGENTANDLKKITSDVLAMKPKGIILDLRNNTGGYLETSIDVASIFMEKGQIVTYQVSTKEGDSKKEYKTSGGDRLSSVPLVILVNNGSASASEILAGALNENKSVDLVGEKTYGKGSVQELEYLNDGSSLRITIAKWLTPSGKNINGEGIEPIYKVDLTEDDYNNDRDPQLDKAKEILDNK
jgi:carboxyl-terminal processing protease